MNKTTELDPTQVAISVFETTAKQVFTTSQAVDKLAAKFESHEANDEARHNAFTERFNALDNQDKIHTNSISALQADLTSLLKTQEQQLAILNELSSGAKKVLARPEVRALFYALWVALVGWLASKGIKVS